jgi:ribonucleoside-diphosphate reductase alpha chain
LLATGSIQETSLPDDLKLAFPIAEELNPADHNMMQSAAQQAVDNAVSKTINLPSYASVEDVALAFEMAYQQGIKGMTVYRASSRQNEVITSFSLDFQTDPLCSNGTCTL